MGVRGSRRACRWRGNPLGRSLALPGKVTVDAESDLLHGEVVGARDVITFQARTPKKLARAFRDSVDDYLAFCRERGEEPNKPYSGKFMVRTDPAVHRAISMAAQHEGESLNSWINACLLARANVIVEAAASRQASEEPASVTRVGHKRRRAIKS